MSPDLDALDALLRQALREGFTDDETVPALLAAFRERAERILAERVGGLEEEVTWRRSMIRGVAAELDLLAARVFWRPLFVRRRLRELAETLRAGLP